MNENNISFCPSCGQKTSGADVFCSNCGYAFQKELGQEPEIGDTQYLGSQTPSQDEFIVNIEEPNPQINYPSNAETQTLPFFNANQINKAQAGFSPAAMQNQVQPPMGQYQPNYYPQQNPQAPKKSNAPIIITIVILVLVLIAGVVAAILLMNDNDDSSSSSRKSKKKNEKTEESSSYESETSDIEVDDNSDVLETMEEKVVNGKSVTIIDNNNVLSRSQRDSIFNSLSQLSSKYNLSLCVCESDITYMENIYRQNKYDIVIGDNNGIHCYVKGYAYTILELSYVKEDIDADNYSNVNSYYLSSSSADKANNICNGINSVAALFDKYDPLFRDYNVTPRVGYAYTNHDSNFVMIRSTPEVRGTHADSNNNIVFSIPVNSSLQVFCIYSGYDYDWCYVSFYDEKTNQNWYGWVATEFLDIYSY